ncbi:hypothetical protein SVAN01_05253 [Stagonosporopsis vannaccii]|nr:hypothetical protein SVAN01_05253 [Stagonosporopsis vannaccii]
MMLVQINVPSQSQGGTASLDWSIERAVWELRPVLAARLRTARFFDQDFTRGWMEKAVLRRKQHAAHLGAITSWLLGSSEMPSAMDPGQLKIGRKTEAISFVAMGSAGRDWCLARNRIRVNARLGCLPREAPKSIQCRMNDDARCATTAGAFCSLVTGVITLLPLNTRCWMLFRQSANAGAGTRLRMEEDSRWSLGAELCDRAEMHALHQSALEGPVPSTMGVACDYLPYPHKSRQLCSALPPGSVLPMVSFWPVPAPVRDLFLDPNFGTPAHSPGMQYASSRAHVNAGVAGLPVQWINDHEAGGPN